MPRHITPAEADQYIMGYTVAHGEHDASSFFWVAFSHQRRCVPNQAPVNETFLSGLQLLTPRCACVSQGSAPQRSAQRPAGFGSEKAWDLALRECYGDFVRQHGIAPGVHRLRELLQAGGHCGAALAPRYPRQPEDADFHP